MSKSRIQEITCPQCYKKDQVTIWDSINAELDPTAKERLINGTLFRYRCKRCGYEANTAFNCLYIDPKINTMIYMSADGDIESVQKAMDEAETTIEKFKIPGMEIARRKRIVMSGNELREKVIIFDADLDDRVVEFMKVFYHSAIKEQMLDLNVQEVYFYVENDQQKIQFIAEDRMFKLDVQEGLYEEFKAEYDEKIKEAGEPYFVNTGFAVKIINEMNAASGEE